jgi:hypothetical protein
LLKKNGYAARFVKNILFPKEKYFHPQKNIWQSPYFVI